MSKSSRHLKISKERKEKNFKNVKIFKSNKILKKNPMKTNVHETLFREVEKQFSLHPQNILDISNEGFSCPLLLRWHGTFVHINVD